MHPLKAAIWWAAWHPIRTLKLAAACAVILAFAVALYGAGQHGPIRGAPGRYHMPTTTTVHRVSR